ncbi:hypothetical protein [Mycolicibacter arupensis]|uniref:Uncharacterized protein n=1 Tax=Mycolicibacter arupensis TaxID=342002 RepID=A0A5C7Y290_9MYCO|nr:hypothetical protein [Mycolicibacter arupensis]TXI55917.1 MAG: hypothetical protein E6Q54_11865 [Mycolicibacter arupensis]
MIREPRDSAHRLKPRVRPSRASAGNRVPRDPRIGWKTRNRALLETARSRDPRIRDSALGLETARAAGNRAPRIRAWAGNARSAFRVLATAHCRDPRIDLYAAVLTAVIRAR